MGGLKDSKGAHMHLPILCVFASLREILFRFLGFRKGEEEKIFDRIYRIYTINRKETPAEEQRRGE